MNMKRKTQTKRSIAQLEDERKSNAIIRAWTALTAPIRPSFAGDEEGTMMRACIPMSYEQTKAIKLETEQMQSLAIVHTQRQRSRIV